jgi:hypothetical protein
VPFGPFPPAPAGPGAAPKFPSSPAPTSPIVPVQDAPVIAATTAATRNDTVELRMAAAFLGQTVPRPPAIGSIREPQCLFSACGWKSSPPGRQRAAELRVTSLVEVCAAQYRVLFDCIACGLSQCHCESDDGFTKAPRNASKSTRRWTPAKTRTSDARAALSLIGLRRPHFCGARCVALRSAVVRMLSTRTARAEVRSAFTSPLTGSGEGSSKNRNCVADGRVRAHRCALRG